MQAVQAQHGERRRFDNMSSSASSCIPMQIASMQQQSSPSSSLRNDCWNSPLCPRNMPTNSLTTGILPPSCGGGSKKPTTPQTNSGRVSPTTEISFQTPNSTTSNNYTEITSASVRPEQSSQPTMKRSRTGNGTPTDIKPEETSPTLSPQESTSNSATANSGCKEKRLPHHVIERRYRENLNSQIESLRAAVPSTSACLTLDMEDIGNANGGSAIRPLSKAAVIAHAAEYMRQLAAQNEEVERMNRELRVTVEALRRLVNCEDCGVVQQIVDAGA